jgi:sugar phosphate isomerase/epimerase
MTRLGVALFTMQELDEPIADMLGHIADAGYEGVEFVNRMHPDIEVEPVSVALEETGLESLGVHVWLHELEDNLPELAETYGALDCDTFVIPYHPDSVFRTERRVRDLVDRLNALADRVQEYGFDLAYHPNHWDMVPMFSGPPFGPLPSLRPTDHLLEFTDPVRTADETPVDNSAVGLFRQGELTLANWRDVLLDGWYSRSGTLSDNNFMNLYNTPLAYILANTDPEKFYLQLDVSFFTQQGYDPVDVITGLSGRIKNIHIKDIITGEYQYGGWPSFVDPGEGVVDFEAVFEAAERNHIEWAMIENGHSTDPLTTLEKGMRALGRTAEKRERTLTSD